MNYARRLARRAASRKGRAAVKDQNRRGFFAERLEDRSLMAADLLSNFHNYSTPTDVNADGTVAANDVLMIINSINSLGARQLPQGAGEGESTGGYLDVDNDGYVSANDVLSVINFLNAEGEAGSSLPNKASYYLQILDSAGNPQTSFDPEDPTSAVRTASIREGSDFYIQLVGQDIRPFLFDPVTPSVAAKRGVFSAYTDILYDTNFATLAVNETQTLTFAGTPTGGKFQLTLPPTPNHPEVPSGTTGDITHSTNSATLATNIQNALNTTLFGGKSGTLVAFDQGAGQYNVTFVGINNVDIPPMTSSQPAKIFVGTANSGDPTNALGAVQFELKQDGSLIYPNDHAAGFVSNYGINDVGAFTGASSLGTDPLPVFRVHLIANLNGSTSKNLVFSPDPLGDGSQSTEDMLRPKHNTLVYGNLNFKDPEVIGTVNDSSATSTQFTAVGSAGSLSTVNDFYYGKELTFTSGALAGQVRTVTGYIGSTQTFIFSTPFSATVGNPSGAPASGDAWDIPSSTTERESSLVDFRPQNNEFLNLIGATVAINSGPYAAVPDTGSVNENLAGGTNSISIPVLTNDTITGVAGSPVKEIKSFDPTTTGGTITKSGDNLIFTPSANFNGTATFTYKGGIVGDGNDTDTAIGTVTVTVAAVNSPPSVTGPNAITATDENAAVTLSGANAITVADNDITEGAGSHELAMTLNSSSGTLTLGSTTGLNSVVGNGSGSVTFTGTPAAVTTALATLSVQNTTERGVTATVTIKADDQGQFGTATAAGTSFTKTISITFPDVNDAPVNLISGTNADGQHVVTIPNSTNTPLAGFSVNDVDVGTGTLTVTLTAGVGTLSGTGFTNSGTASVTITGTQAAVNAALATLAYTPLSGSTTATTLLFVTSDNGSTGTGGTKTTTSNVTIDLDPGFRPAPIADSKTIDEGTSGPVTIDVLANDFKSDPPTVTTITGVTQPAQGSVATDGATVTFTPPADINFFTPSGPLTFTYTINDDSGSATPPTEAQRTATVSVNIKNVPDAPVATGSDGPYAAVFDSAAATQTPLVVAAADGVLKNDTDVDNNYGVANYATLKAVLNTTTTRGTLVLAADGSFTYTPGPGTTDDSFTYHVNAVTPESGAAGMDSNIVTVNIHITGRPIATNDHFNVLEQGNPASSGNVLTGQSSSPASAADEDTSDHQSLTAVNLVQLQSAATVGTVVLNTDGSFSYTPPAGQNFNTTRPAAPDISFTYQAKTLDGRLSLPATVSLTVQEVNDPPTAAADAFLAVKKNAAGTIGVNQEINVTQNDSTDPDGGDESVSVVGISLTNGSFGASELTTATGGKVRLVGGKIFYDSPTNAPVSDSFFYQISDNSSGARSGPLFASAQVNISVVDFVPKTISGSVYVDSNGDGIKDKALGGVEIRLIGVDFTDKVLEDTPGKGYLSVTTDASGNYTFPASGIGLAPPKVGTSYQLVEVQPKYLTDGLDKWADSTPNLDTTTNLPLVLLTNALVNQATGLENAFTLKWSITDLSGNLTDVNFVEGGINTDPNNGGLSNSAGLKGELLASSGKNGFIVATDLSTGSMLWDFSIEGDANSLQGVTLLSAQLSSDLSLLTVTLRNGTGLHTVTLTQGYSIPGSSARFRILGVGGNGQYIVRIDGSYNGTTVDPRTGLYDGMFVSNSATLQGAEGEASSYRDYSNSADAVFSEQAWA